MLSINESSLTMASLADKGLIVAKDKVSQHRFEAKIFIGGAALLVSLVVVEIAILHLTHTMPNFFSDPAFKIIANTSAVGAMFAITLLVLGSIRILAIKKDKTHPLSRTELEIQLKKEMEALDSSINKTISKELKDKAKYMEEVRALKQKIQNIREENKINCINIEL